MKCKIMRFQKLMWRNMMKSIKSKKVSILYYSVLGIKLQSTKSAPPTQEISLSDVVWLLSNSPAYSSRASTPASLSPAASSNPGTSLSLSP